MTPENPNLSITFSDPGLDDMTAIRHMSKQSPDGHHILASIFGNVPERKAFANLVKLHRVFGLGDSWSLARGPNRPLNPAYARTANLATYGGNGEDGLWKVPIPDNCPPSHPNLIDLKTISPDSIKEIISLGPLTGPIQLQREGANPDKVLIMGGAFLQGNVKALNSNGVPDINLPRLAEWNVFQDPLAANKYFQTHAGTNVWVVTKDTCMGARLEAQTIIDKETKPTVDHRFMQQVLRGWADGYKKINPEVWNQGLMLADLIAVVSYKNPDIVGWEQVGIEVDTTIGPNLGRTTKSSSNPPVNVANEIIDHKTLFEAINATIFGK